MNFLHTWHPQPILVSFGGWSIHWYGLMLALGALAGYFLIRWLSRQPSAAIRDPDTIFMLLVISGLLGGRFYHVLNELGYYFHHPLQVLAFWNGGLAIHGALAGGALALWWYARHRHTPFLALADQVLPAVAIGQAIGRWGNYFNQELFGRPTAVAWGIPIDLAHRPMAYLSSSYFHPTFLYESLADLLLCTALILLWRRRPAPGTVLGMYLIGYAIIRILTELLRVDRTPIVGAIRLPIIVSGAMIVAAVVILIVLRRTHAPRP